MEKITLFALDRREKGGEIFGYTYDKNVAMKIAKGRGFWGSDAGVIEHRLDIFESLEDYLSYVEAKNNRSKEQIRANALNKLTSEEKRVLGLE